MEQQQQPTTPETALPSGAEVSNLEGIDLARQSIEDVTAERKAIFGPEPAAKDRAHFKHRVHFWWNRTVEGILETGWCLIEAQATLSDEEWSKFRTNDVPFDYSVLRKLMKIAQNTRICNPKYKDMLPPSWSSLYEIA